VWAVENVLPRKRGARAKVEGGFKSVLYVRVTAQLLAQLDHVVASQRTHHPGLSRADIVRELLGRELDRLIQQEP
jgi:hypothetical protein